MTFIKIRKFSYTASLFSYLTDYKADHGDRWTNWQIQEIKQMDDINICSSFIADEGVIKNCKFVSYEKFLWVQSVFPIR